MHSNNTLSSISQQQSVVGDTPGVGFPHPATETADSSEVDMVRKEEVDSAEKACASESSLLARIRSFLPRIATANSTLPASREEDAVSVLVIDSDDEEDSSDDDDDNNAYDDAASGDVDENDGGAGKEGGPRDVAAGEIKPKQFICFDTVLYEIDDEKQSAENGPPLSKKKYLIIDTTEERSGDCAGDQMGTKGI